MTGIIQDIRFALRQLHEKPWFTAAAVLTLALGIGGNAAMFSVVNAVLLRPLAFHDPSQLVVLHEGVPPLGFSKIGFSAPDLTIYQQGQKSFEGMAPYQNRTFELSGTGEPQRITGARVSANLFSLLGIEPCLGRSFRPEEDRPGVAVVVLSYGLWQNKFGGSPEAIGRTVTLDRIPYTVIGVMPRDFHFPLPGSTSQSADLWVPIAFTQAELDGWGSMFNSDVVARLRPGVMLAQARSEADALARRIFQAYPAELLKAFGNATLVALVDPMQTEVSGTVRPLLLLLQAAVGLVLLIACTNVALLLLARASGRGREIAIRAALGAARSRLIAQLLTESLILAVAGGIVGLGLAAWSKSLLLKQIPTSIPLPREVPLDGVVLSFTLLMTLLTGTLFGLAPALHATRRGMWSGIQEGGRSGAGSRARHRAQGTLVVFEFGLVLILLVGAGLLLRSFSKLLAVDPGFRPDKVLAMSVSLPSEAYPHAAEIRNYYQEAILRVSQVPGVISAAGANDLPFNGNELDAVETERGENRSTTPAVRQTWVLGDYLHTMGIPLLRGRLFTPEDRQGTQPVMVISKSTAQTLWPNQDAVGKRIRRGGADAPWRTVVGIVGDVSDGALSAMALPHCYSPYLQETDDFIADNVGGVLRTLNLAVRTQGEPGALTTSIVAQLHQLDPALAISNVRTMQEEVNDTVAPQRFNAILVAIYASLALLLALVGIYGVLAYTVMEQTREIGIRMALGAPKGDILKRVVSHGMRLVAAGATLGLLGAWGLTRMMNSLLYVVAPRDPITFLGVTGVLITAALLACYIPARRATKVDPIVALRDE